MVRRRASAVSNHEAPISPAAHPSRRGLAAAPRDEGSKWLLRHLAAALRDQPRGPLVAHVDPQPAQRDAEAVAQADQEVDVGDAPDPPRDRAAQLELAEID